MSYCTLQDLERAFPVETVALLLDRDGNGASDIGALDAAIAYVDAKIDSYLVRKYEVPLTTPNQIITGIACDMVRYQLSPDKTSPVVKERNQQAKLDLESIASGRMRLDAATTSSQGLGVEYTERERTFTDDTLKGFMG